MDATFSKKKWREGAKKIAESINVIPYLIEVVCIDENVAKQRMDIRFQENENAAPYEIRIGQKKTFESITFAERDMIINNTTKEFVYGILETFLKRIDRYNS